MMALRAGLVAAVARVAASCWGGGITREMCCGPDHGPRGNPDCWDAVYTFERCCGGQEGGQPPQAPPEAAPKVDPASVPSLRLPRGIPMPMSGLGLCCRESASGDLVRQSVLDYLLMGGRHLDDATLYSNHREVGEGIRQAIAAGVPRSEIFFTTKIWPADFGFESASAWLQQSLEELGLEYIDLVLLHLPKVEQGLECVEPRACRQETWLALQRARGRGQISNLGVSNFGPRQMGEILALGGAPIAANQFEYHPWVPQVHRDTAEWCHRHGIAVTAYGSMGSSRLAWQMVSQEALNQIGAQHGKTGGQVLLRWAVQQNVSVIPGTGNPAHMAENLRIFDFELAAHEMAFLDGIPEDQRMLHFGHTPDQYP